MKPLHYSILLLVFFAACTAPKNTTITKADQPGIAIQGKLFAAAFMQNAAEYHALCLQAYNIARLRLDENLKQTSSKLKAIITDLDETALDNSTSEVHQDLQGKGFDPAEWAEWTALAKADTVPGAVSFFKYAASKNVEIFYITNRDENDRAGTLLNLQRFNFPNADNEHLLVRQNTSGKETRRQQIMADHDVVLLLGDNLSDFSDQFDKKSSEQRVQVVQQLSGQFGNRFIILPNPVYGDWESSLYQYKQLTNAQKDSAITSRLKSY